MTAPDDNHHTHGAVLIIGGGVGGMRAAIDVAEAGLKAYLVEGTPALGGRVAQLGFMFPTHDCVLCRGTSDHGYGCTRPSISPILLDNNLHPNIEVLTSTDVLACDGQAGDFTVRLRRQPQYAKCINCGLCADVCPVERPSGFQMGLTLRKAISKSAPRAVPDSYYLLEKTEACDECRKCVEVCPTAAVNLDAAVTERTIHVGAVILAVGYKPFNPREMQEFGFGRFPNVITSMQYERLASHSGPTEGTVARPSDGRPPKKIAWLQCIGSRDQRAVGAAQVAAPYCSAICCMYATKEAMLAKQRLPDVEAHIFTMDERAFNKEYNAYYTQARDRHGVQYTRCRISEIRQDPATHDLMLRYPSGRMHGEAAPGQGPIVEDRYDMVVLAVGVRPPEQADLLARALGIELNEYGFCQTDKFSPLETSRPGVFVCGAFASPKEIGETIIDASGAAAEAMRLMREKLGRLPSSRQYPFIYGEARLLQETGLLGPERDVTGEKPRVGVFVCGCGGSIADVVNAPQTAAFAAGLPDVVHAEYLPFACFPDGLNHIRRATIDLELNRVVVGACSHRTHESLFQRTAREAGLNPYLTEMVNLREQCAWVHAADPDGATRKAKELVRLGVSRIRPAQAISKEPRAPSRTALVIGGGVSGMTAALAIADSGFDVHLVEKSDALGGNLHHIYYVAEGANPQRLLRDLVNRIIAHERITTHMKSEVVRHAGSVGAFRSVVRARAPGGAVVETEIDHGATVLATGARESSDGRYGLGLDPRVVRQSELEELIAHQPERIVAMKHIAMIQCVRPEGAPDYCSRTCCTNTLKNAIRIKMLNPNCRVTILYKDIITYGFREKFYLEARRRGVLFVRYTDGDRPIVEIPNPKLQISNRKSQIPKTAPQSAIGNQPSAIVVRIHEHVFGQTLELQPDLIALSMSIAPGEDTASLAQALHVPLSTEGFFLEAHLKMRPMDFMEEGIFLAGIAHYPKFIEECISYALAAAGRAITVLSKEPLYIGGVVAIVDQAKCTGCLTCVRSCPFGIPQIRVDFKGVGGLTGAAWIDPARCQGCGTCTAECPAKAIELLNYRDEQIMSGVGRWGVRVEHEL
ncbi:MAG: CoB--CoM heterodisulfide reductase iron-sulfur subunit A family protein [Chloroflexi bacterium]|nr:CoB--CoM heterodisulfide reductase iron-sulfur subunit A family protein [Chloroflexota bacterium]